jgi:hypothetical protein
MSPFQPISYRFLKHKMRTIYARCGLLVSKSVLPPLLYHYIQPPSQKIDKLKSQLTSLADLIKPATLHDNVQDRLNDEEFQLLREAGIISGSTRTKKGGRNPKHIVFVDGADEGILFFVWTRKLMDLPQSQHKNTFPATSFPLPRKLIIT